MNSYSNWKEDIHVHRRKQDKLSVDKRKKNITEPLENFSSITFSKKDEKWLLGQSARGVQN